MAVLPPSAPVVDMVLGWRANGGEVITSAPFHTPPEEAWYKNNRIAPSSLKDLRGGVKTFYFGSRLAQLCIPATTWISDGGELELQASTPCGPWTQRVEFAKPLDRAAEQEMRDSAAGARRVVWHPTLKLVPPESDTLAARTTVWHVPAADHATTQLKIGELAIAVERSTPAFGVTCKNGIEIEADGAVIGKIRSKKAPPAIAINLSGRCLRYRQIGYQLTNDPDRPLDDPGMKIDAPRVLSGRVVPLDNDIEFFLEAAPKQVPREFANYRWLEQLTLADCVNK